MTSEIWLDVWKQDIDGRVKNYLVHMVVIIQMESGIYGGMIKSCT